MANDMKNSESYEKSRKIVTTDGWRPKPSGLQSWNDGLYTVVTGE